jgi:hypothetical protein
MRTRRVARSGFLLALLGAGTLASAALAIIIDQ